MSRKCGETAPRIREARANVLRAAVQYLRLLLDTNESPWFIGHINHLAGALPPANVLVSGLPVHIHRVTCLEPKRLERKIAF